MSMPKRVLWLFCGVLGVVAALLIARAADAPGGVAAAPAPDAVAESPRSVAPVRLAPKPSRRRASESESPMAEIEPRVALAEGAEVDDGRDTDSDPQRMLRGRVLDLRGEPIVHPSVSVELKDELGEVVMAEASEGSYRALGLHSGSWWLEADAAGYGPRRLELWLPPTGQDVEQDVVLEERAVLSVYAFTPEWKPTFRGASTTPEVGLISVIATDVEPTGEVLTGYAPGAGVYGVGKRLRGREERKGEGRAFVGTLELTTPPPARRSNSVRRCAWTRATRRRASTWASCCSTRRSGPRPSSRTRS